MKPNVNQLSRIHPAAPKAQNSFNKECEEGVGGRLVVGLERLRNGEVQGSGSGPLSGPMQLWFHSTQNATRIRDAARQINAERRRTAHPKTQWGSSATRIRMDVSRSLTRVSHLRLRFIALGNATGLKARGHRWVCMHCRLIAARRELDTVEIR